MNKQYRPLEVGETINEGDEYYCVSTGRWEAIRYHAGYKWKNKTTKARRPIPLSTDTEALASEMAGLTDAVADAPREWGDEDDLTWLASTVSEWFSNSSYICRPSVTTKDAPCLWIGNKTPEGDNAKNYYTKDQWLQRRRELGLEVNPKLAELMSVKPEPDWDSAPEGATHVLMHDIHGASWRRKGGFDSWYYWDEDKWVFMGEGGFMSDEYIERPQPEQSKSTEPEYDMSIHSSPDAVRWADFYMSVWPNGCSDRDTMIGWFANAMEAMADSLRTEPQEQEWDGEAATLAIMIINCENMTASWLKSLAKAKQESEAQKENEQLIRALMKDADIDEGTIIASFKHRDSAVFLQAEKLVNAGWRKVEE